MSAGQLTDAEGVLGWRGLVSGGGVIYFDTPEEACRYNYDHWTAGNRPYHGSSPSSTWYHYDCDWDGFPVPVTIPFECETGFTRTAPQLCLRARDLNAPSLPQSPPPDMCGAASAAASGPVNPTAGNPIEIATGRKVEAATDFETADGLLKVGRNYISRMGDQFWLPSGVLRGGGLGWNFDFGPTVMMEFTNTNQTLYIYQPDGTRYTLDRHNQTGV